MDTRRKTLLFVLGLASTVVPQLTYSKSRYPTADISLLWSNQPVFPDDGREYVPPPPPRTKTKQHHVKHEATNDNDENDVRHERKVCETEECKIIAKEFLTSINKTIDPCEDFYEFTCSGWLAKDVIPPNAPVWSRFLMFQNGVYYRIKEILDVPVEPSDILPVRQAKKWYQSCTDVENLEKRGVTPMESIVMQAGGWPITMDEEEWDSEQYTWQNIERHYAGVAGSRAFYKFRIMGPRPYANASITIMPMRMPTVEDAPLKSLKNNSKHYDAYVKLVESVAKSFVQHNKAKVSEERMSKEAKEIVDFEIALSQLGKEGYSREEPLLRDLNEWFDNITDYSTDPKAKIDLTSMVKRSFDEVNIEISQDTEISVENDLYAKGLVQLLEKTPARIIANYVHWMFVGTMIPFTTEHLRNELSTFIAQEFGVKERRPRWSECVTDMKMSHAAAYVFVNKYFTNSKRNAVLEMVENIRSEIQEKIEKSNWLDDESKIIATGKINKMRVFLGYPDWYKNETAVINHYKGITIGAEYFDNVLSYKRYEYKKDLKGYLGTHEPDDDWKITPLLVNGLYNPQKNALNLPAADFQPPLFTPQLPNAVNYAVAGVIAGHEMGHGFDDSGIGYSAYGNGTELSETILKSYYQLAECFIDQYGEYYSRARGLMEESTSTETTGNNTRSREIAPRDLAEMTNGENIADITGIQAVFQAYKKLNKDARSMALPGLEEYTDEQLFFLSFGSIWCNVATPEYEEMTKNVGDSHSPAKMRVIGSLSNTIDFAKVFNCPKGSPMNPIDKCSIWDKSEPTPKVKISSIIREHLPWETQWKT